MVPVLMPSLESHPAPSTARCVPTDREWADLRPEIERLYVAERHKLRHVMQHVESKYGFTAT